MVEHNPSISERLTAAYNLRLTYSLKPTILGNTMLHHIAHFPNGYQDVSRVVVVEVEDRRLVCDLFSPDGALVQAEEVEGAGVGGYEEVLLLEDYYVVEGKRPSVHC